MFEKCCHLLVRSGNIYDCGMVHAIIDQNRYRLPPVFSSEDIILDIGAHVGSFAYACLSRGAGKVYAFDPDRDNIRLCAFNLRHFGRKTYLRRAPVWRSDTFDMSLTYTGSVNTPSGENYGGGNVVFDDGRRIPVQGESLDSILSNIRKVRLLKLDCESSEWPILFTSRLLECVEEIVGEYHEIGGKNNSASIPGRASVSGYSSYTVHDLISFLNRYGYSTEVTAQTGSNIGTFFARSRKRLQ